jgi:hypothetical protein
MIPYFKARTTYQGGKKTLWFKEMIQKEKKKKDSNKRGKEDGRGREEKAEEEKRRQVCNKNQTNFPIFDNYVLKSRTKLHHKCTSRLFCIEKKKAKSLKNTS